MKKLLVTFVILFAAISSSFAYSNYVYADNANPIYVEIPIYASCNFSFSPDFDSDGTSLNEAALIDLRDNSYIYRYVGYNFSAGTSSSGTFDVIAMYISCPGWYCWGTFAWWY